MIETWADCVIAAQHRAKENGRGYAYAILWPLGHYTVEDNKPSLRGPGMRVMEFDENGREVYA